VLGTKYDQSFKTLVNYLKWRSSLPTSLYHCSRDASPERLVRETDFKGGADGLPLPRQYPMTPSNLSES
jgi:hypothetical protein